MAHSLISHTAQEQLAFAASGLTLAPEAAHRLAARGIVAPVDLVFSPEAAQAAEEAPRASL